MTAPDLLGELGDRAGLPPAAPIDHLREPELPLDGGPVLLADQHGQFALDLDGDAR